MIEKIKLKNIASYKEEALLKTDADKKINLMYGLNGSGKTMLSDYLKSPKEENFSDCTIDGFNKNSERIMVYNHTFIDENFYESDVQSGIFTLAKHNKEALKSIESAEREKKDLKESIDKQDSIIAENQKKVTNIDQVIELINKHFLDFGIQDFKIIKHEDDKYKIQRNGEAETEFKSFSEGEKTVISFLYFVEKCRGKESQEDTKGKIIVIDDPISSLSHMYVYNVSQIINKVFFEESNNFLQTFILTHNLYFFNELIKLSRDSSKLFRVLKNNTSSYIKEMEKTEIQNEYQSYWSIIKDLEYEDSMPIVANAMRNIIEYFFAFIDKSESINNIFQKPELDDNKYQSFKRYIDRESHSDPMNISDYKDFKYDIFKEAFKKVFEVTKYKEHYDKMMS